MIEPHGGTLKECLVKDDAERAKLLEEAATLKAVEIDERVLADVEMLGTGGMSPLDGFVSEADYKSIVKDMRLADGTVWPFPIGLAVEPGSVSAGERIALTSEGTIYAIVDVSETFGYDKKEEAINVYKTDDEAHPGVAAVYAQADEYVAGKITVLQLPSAEFPTYHKSPAETRAYFAEKGWKQVCAFQTRNPIHRAHEYLTKVALEIVDGVMLHPLVGKTKGDDIPADTRMKCYETLMENYYPNDRVLLSVFPAAMRYAGPREALFHALARKNYGCTHFIVGRDHAGVGNYYTTYEAQELFDQFTAEEIGITPLKFEHSFWCTKCGGMATTKTCAHDAEFKTFLSGTKVREMLVAGEELPAEFSRPEVSKILVEAYAGKE